ncbi:MAG: hypothetical protein E7164_04310 [Firmicutes bacterium]|nr:hypothetical protein [Bacillota bacterium]
MNSRVDKYYDNNKKVESRTVRNNQLYKEISKTELENFEVKSNATVIGNNRGSIDVEKIKSILDTHYNDAPKRRSIQLETPKQEVKAKPIFETKEYDINVILDKAKESKVESYNEARSKKLRDTQFDILSNLNINREDFIEDYDGDGDIKYSESREDSTAARKLEELINTITLNEQDVKKEKEKIINEVSRKNESINDESTDPLDIFEDLKGDDNTAILEGLQEKTEKLIEKIEHTTSLDNSFFTKSNSFKETDFEDFKDIEEKEGTGIVIKIIIALLVVVFLVGVVILVKSFS